MQAVGVDNPFGFGVSFVGTDINFQPFGLTYSVRHYKLFKKKLVNRVSVSYTQLEVQNNWNQAKADAPVVINLHELHTGFKVKSAVVMGSPYTS